MPKIIRPPFLKGRKRCIFCGRPGKITKEHLFADWLRKYFPRDASTTHTTAHIFWPKSFISKQPIDDRQTRQGHPGSKKIRAVCRDCNNRWLSQLETWAKKAIPRLMTGERCNLVPSGQTKLATWAVKTAMVAERFKPHDSSIPQNERTWLRDNLRPPDNWFVWIAAYQGDDWHDLAISQIRGGLSTTPVPNPDVAPYYIQATTFGLGHLLITVLGSSFPTIRDVFSGRELDGAIQIWPQHPRSILWPPNKVFDDAEAYKLANIIRLSGAFDHSFDPGAEWTFTF